MRNLISDTSDLYLPLSNNCEQKWRKWNNALKPLEELHVPRCFLQTSLKKCADNQLQVFSDASEKAIATVAFHRAVDQHGNIRVGFVSEKSEVALKHGHTIMRCSGFSQSC